MFVHHVSMHRELAQDDFQVNFNKNKSLSFKKNIHVINAGKQLMALLQLLEP